MEKMVDFIQKTYHGGYGLTFGETKVSAWYGEDGMRIAYGTGARYARTAQILSWEDMYHRIGELLDQGRFATNVELAEMRSFERKELAEKLWYMDRDINHAENPQTYMSIVRDLRGGFPDDTAKLMVYLSEPESYKVWCTFYCFYLVLHTFIALSQLKKDQAKRAWSFLYPSR